MPVAALIPVRPRRGLRRGILQVGAVGAPERCRLPGSPETSSFGVAWEGLRAAWS